MTDRALVVLVLALIIASIFSGAMLTDNENTKQRTIMMKTCIESGGNWSMSWNNRPICERK